MACGVAGCLAQRQPLGLAGGGVHAGGHAGASDERSTGRIGRDLDGLAQISLGGVNAQVELVLVSNDDAMSSW